MLQRVFDSERFCVSLCERISKGECSPIEFKDGIFTHSDGGQILHFIENPASQNSELATKTFFEKYFSETKKTVFSVIGEKHGTELICQAIEKTKGIKREHFQEYFLMENQPENIEPPFISRLKKATEKDLPKLSKMQFDYENEEVAYKSGQIDKKASELNLKKNILKDRVYYFLDNGEIVSKLSINAIGKKYIQIGGVFTKIEQRKKGFAKKMISEFLSLQSAAGRGVVLFVKKENESALRLYETLNFKRIGEFEIAYF